MHSMIDESIKEQVEKILEKERWAARVSGKVDGALNVLFLLDISKAITALNKFSFIFMIH